MFNFFSVLSTCTTKSGPPRLPHLRTRAVPRGSQAQGAARAHRQEPRVARAHPHLSGTRRQVGAQRRARTGPGYVWRRLRRAAASD